MQRRELGKLSSSQREMDPTVRRLLSSGHLWMSAGESSN